jgi:NAD(P)H-hydrate repair Nnr-like enzyme with NAD(P)H-hydrate dehydratase domain
VASPPQSALVDWGSPELMLREAGAVGDDYDAWIVGPGLGGGERALALVDKAVRYSQPVVLDADALNAIASNPSLRDVIAQRGRGAPTLATPHPAEAARLLGCDTQAVQADRVAAATSIATQWRAHVVLKGTGSIVARPAARSTSMRAATQRCDGRIG